MDQVTKCYLWKPPNALLNVSGLVLFTIGSLIAQVKDDLFVERIKDGERSFPYNVNDMTQDEQGFLWLASGRGLVRYDGRKLKYYDHINVESAGRIAIDKKGKIWIGTFLDGVTIFDPKVNIANKLEKIIPQVKFEDPIGSIHHLGDSTWVTSGYNIYIIKLDIKQVYKIELPLNVSRNNFKIIAIDWNGKFWISKGTNGLIYYDPKLHYAEDLSYLVDYQEVNSGSIENDSILVVGTSNGTGRINVNQRKVKNISHHQLVGFSELLSNYINVIYIDPETKQIWQGSAGAGALIGNRSIVFDKNNENSLKDNNVHCIFKAKDGTMFIGTELGLNKINTHNQNFKTISLSDLFVRQNSQLMRMNQGIHISTLFQDNRRNYWVGTIGDGLYKLDTAFNIIQSYKGSPNRFRKERPREPISSLRDKIISPDNYLSNEYILSISEDKNGNIWIGSFNGVTFLDSKRNFSKIYFKSDKTDNPFTVHCFGEYLVIFRDKGFDESKESSLHLSHIDDPEKVIKKYKSGKFWISTDQYNNLFLDDGDGISLFNPENFNFEILIPEKHQPLFAGELFYNSKTKEVWLVSPKALHRYDVSTGQTEGYLLPDNEDHKSIIMDNQDNIWIATNVGLLYFNRKTKKITQYNEKSGLRITYFEDNAKLINHKGELYFGGFTGFVKLNPEEIKEADYGYDLVVTDIRSANQSITRLPFYNSLNGSVEIQNDFTIPYKYSTIQVEFTDLNLANSSKYSYAYKLLPIDNQWRMTREPVTALYTNLSKGNYSLLLRVIDPIQKSQIGKEKQITIQILPAPWQAWWAYALYFLFGSAILYMSIRQAIIRANLKSEAFRNKLEANKLHELDSLKSRFFANISHEFRTPLTLILAPLEKKLKESNTLEEKAEFSLMHRSASRLLTLVNQLLDLSRLEAGTLKLNLKYTDLGKFLSAITDQFSSIANSRDINFLINFSETIELFIDHDKLEKIITNLLSNAFKFTPTNGTVTISIHARSANETFHEGFTEIIVSDTGPGIAKEHLNKIFDRFYQVDNSTTKEREGAGIGLALSKELVELHKGSIAVSSEPGNGSAFTVRLPLGFLHLKADELTLESSRINQPPDYVEFHPEDQSLKKDASTETILVIEDNADLRYFIRNELVNTFTVFEAEDGEQGLAMAFGHIPTLIITDLMMPKRDGIQLCLILKNDERTSHIPIILLTAKADVETKLQGLHVGADEYISKPFLMEELKARIHNLIENRKHLREKYARQLALRPSEITVDSVEERYLKNIMQVVETHISDTHFGVEQFALEAGMSQAQLYRKLHALTGFTPNELVRDVRLQRAADLFRQHAGNVADVAYQVGFNSMSYFAKCFKEKFKVSPSEYLKS